MDVIGRSYMLITSYISITSVNLMASLGSLSAIARQRPAFMSIVVQAFESLHGKKLLFMSFAVFVLFHVTKRVYMYYSPARRSVLGKNKINYIEERLKITQHQKC